MRTTSSPAAGLLVVLLMTVPVMGPAASADAFYDRHPELWGKKTLRFFYSNIFITPEAKAAFVPPDRTPFPKSQKAPAELLP